MDYEEALQLEGNMNDIHLFSDRLSSRKAVLIERGNNFSTKYFLIPREIRHGIDLRKDITCQRIDIQDKTFFIFTVEKQVN